MKTLEIKIVGIVSAVLIVSAGMAGAYALYSFFAHRSVVLEQPIRIEDGFVVSRPFTVDVAANYQVEIECKRTIPFETLNQSLNGKLAAEFAVTSATDRIVSGDSSKDVGMSSSNSSLSRYIATFDAVPGVPYNLALRITASLPELASRPNPASKSKSTMRSPRRLMGVQRYGCTLR